MLQPVRALAKQAGSRIMAVYASDFEVTLKTDASPLTAADLAAHAAITAGLAELTPDIPVLSEESAAAISVAERRRWSRYWLVDPLDGTKEFIDRNGEFTVNIALIDAHYPALGVVGVPARDLCYFAVRGQGASRQREGEPAQSIRVRPPNGTLRVVGSRSHANPELHAYVERLGECQLLSVGSALKFCLVAEGSAHLYPRFGPTSEWDTAAAQCVLEQAGGAVVTLDGKRLAYNRKDSLLNPNFIACADPSRDWLANA